MAKSTSISAKIKLRDDRFVVIYHRNQLFKTGIAIDTPDEFNKKDGVLTSRYKGVEDYRVLNNNIKEKLHLINGLITDANKKGVDSLDYIGAYFKAEERKLKKLKLTNQTSVSDAFSEYLNLKVVKLKDIVSEKSLDRYKSELTRLQDYEKIKPSTLDDLSELSWFTEFARYLSKPHKKTFEVYNKKTEATYTQTKILQQSNSTLSRFLQDLISFCNFIQKSNPDIIFPIEDISGFQSSLALPSDNSDNIITISKELWDVLKKHKPNPKFDAEVRTYDLYCFAVCTGLRYSDCIRLNDAYVKDNIITMNATKTRNKFTVAMNSLAVSIYNKYGRDFRNKFPKNQQINKNLKKMLKRIPAFCEDVVVYKYVLGKEKDAEKIEKGYQVYKFHSSRRTFVSFAIQKGAKLDQVKRFTGWKDLRTLNAYWNVFNIEKVNNDLSVLNF